MMNFNGANNNKDRLSELGSLLQFIIRENDTWLVRENEWLTEKQHDAIKQNQRMAFFDSNTELAKLVELLLFERLLSHDIVNVNTSRSSVYGREKISRVDTYDLVYVGAFDGTLRIGRNEIDSKGIEELLRSKNKDIKIVTDGEIRDVYERTKAQKLELNLSDLLEVYGPLKVLIVSDEVLYREVSENFFNSRRAGGKKLFEITKTTKEELATNNARYKADILLFDLRGNPDLNHNSQLPLLNDYLSRNQKNYAIVTTTNEQWEELANRSDWDNLFRDSFSEEDISGAGTPLTWSLRIFEKRPNEEEYMVYHEGMRTDLLYDAILPTIWKLRGGSLNVRRRVASLPTEFDEFYKRIIREFGSSRLIKQSLDVMAEFEPDKTLKILKELQPEDDDGYSVPQHCYPPWKDLAQLNQDQVLETIKDQGGIPLSLYIHFPYCLKRCDYCDYSSVALEETDTGKLRDAQKTYLDLLRTEIQIIYNKTGWEVVVPKGIHIGGGTPSLMLPEIISQLGTLIHQFFDTSERPQIGFEVNPGTTTVEKLDAFEDIGANRASLGLQSFTDHILLRWLHRWYDPAKGAKAVEELLKRWPDNTNIDLLYGNPGRTMDSWERDLNAGIISGAPSITFYMERISPRTGYPRGQEFPSLYERMLMYIMAVEKFRDVGLTQSADNHMISSRHEQKYTYRDSKKKGGNTLGIGMSSYSLFPGIIYFNIGAQRNRDPNNIVNYSRAVLDNEVPVEIGRILSQEEQMEIFITQGLKLSGVGKSDNGVNKGQFRKRFGQTIKESFPHTGLLLDNGILNDNLLGYIGLTYKGLAFEELAIKSYWGRNINTP